MIADKRRLIQDLAILGNCFGRKMAEEDLATYAAILERHLDDRQWAWAFDWFTGPWQDQSEAPRFMPTPQELMEAGLRAPEPGVPYIRGTELPLAEALKSPELVGQAVERLEIATGRPPVDADAGSTEQGRPTTRLDRLRRLLGLPGPSEGSP